MPKRDDSNTTVLHPKEIPGSLRWYAKGCRCAECRSANTTSVGAYRRRRAMGISSPYERIPNDEARAAIQRMRDQGMVWDGMAEIVGCDRRDLQRVKKTANGKITHQFNEMILHAERIIQEQPHLLHRKKQIFPEAERMRWMISCLQAVGWTASWIGEQVGWTHPLSVNNIPGNAITLDFWARLEGVFKAYNGEWGPSRLGAIRSWRSGKFPINCYNIESYDPRTRYLPIPGSLHPDLVTEACTYRKNPEQGKTMLMIMRRRWGQWDNPKCADAASWNWHQLYFPNSTITSDEREVCRAKAHRHHVLPANWQDTQPGNT